MLDLCQRIVGVWQVVEDELETSFIGEGLSLFAPFESRPCAAFALLRCALCSKVLEQ